jgi:hypothetical protein
MLLAEVCESRDKEYSGLGLYQQGVWYEENCVREMWRVCHALGYGVLQYVSPSLSIVRHKLTPI